MGVFSRLSDIINSNINAMLDKAEDPEKIARLIIQEMEDCLVEVRSAAARSMADKKEYERDITQLDQTRLDWTAKAELAVEKGREDLARGALSAKQRAEREIDSRRLALKAIEEVSLRRQDDPASCKRNGRSEAKHRALVVRREAPTPHRDASRIEVNKVDENAPLTAIRRSLRMEAMPTYHVGDRSLEAHSGTGRRRVDRDELPISAAAGRNVLPLRAGAPQNLRR